MIITSFDCTIPSCTFPILHHFPFFFQIHFCLSHGGKRTVNLGKGEFFEIEIFLPVVLHSPLLKAKIFFSCSNQSLNMGEGSSSFFSFHYYWSPLNYIYIYIYGQIKGRFPTGKARRNMRRRVVHHKRGKKKKKRKKVFNKRLSFPQD